MKPFWASKINWVAAIAVVMGFLTDPKFTELIDPWWSAQILKAVGLVTFVLRTWFTSVESKLTLR